MRRPKLVIGILAACLLLAGRPPVQAADARPIERFTAFAASLGTGQTAIIEITISRWSTDEEREMLLTTLQEFGRDKLIDALQKIKPPAGTVWKAGSLAYDLYYARNHQQPDGSRRIVLATNRRVAFGEVANSARSLEYQVTLIEIRIDKDGKGEGKLVPAAKVSWDTKARRIEIENYNALPVELLQVKATKP